MSWTINEQSKTSETQYFDASYSTSLNLSSSLSTDVDSLVTSITTNPTTLDNTTVTGLSQSSSSGGGGGAVFTLVSTGNTITGITVTTGGSGYEVQDTITFLAADLAATAFNQANNDLVITLYDNNLAVNDALLSSITQQTVGATADTYTGIASTSSGTGTGALFNVVVGSGGTVTGLGVVAAGSGYVIDDTITIANGDIGGGGTNLIITLTIDDFGADGSGGIIVPDNVTTDSTSIDVSGYTAGTISFKISPRPSDLSTVPDALVASITTNPTNLDDTTVTGLSPTTSSSGAGAIFTLVSTGNTITGITVTTAGSGYLIPGTITFSAVDLAATAFNQANSALIITLDENDFVKDLSTVPGAISGQVQWTGAVGPFLPSRIYSGISPTGGSGSGLIITVSVPAATDGGFVHELTITVTSPGSGYIVGDFVVIPNNSLGAGSITATFPLSLTAPAFVTWIADSTLEMSVVGGIDINSFVAYTLEITQGEANFTFYVDWSIPLETVALRVNNNTTISTEQTITVSSIRMMTESNGGGLGYVSTSGTSVGPGGATPQIQFNDSGNFAGASGALYDKTAGQVQLANGSAANPMLAFSDGVHPAGNYDTGIYRAGVNDIGFSVGGVAKVGILDADSGDFIEGLNVGIPGNIAGIRRLSATAANSWEDGHLGNSEGIYFTPQDFSSDSLTTVYTPTSTMSVRGVIRNRPWVGVTDGDTLVNACKLIPKGFVITEDSEITIFTAEADGTGTLPHPFQDITGTELNVYTQTLTTGLGAAYNGQQLLLNLNYTTNAPTSITTAMSGTSPPNGLTYLVISWNPGQQLDTTTANPGLYGAYLTMTRI